MTETVTYLTTLRCENEHDRTFAHEGAWVPPDHSEPMPDVHYCPECAVAYPDDLGVAMVESFEAEVVKYPEIEPGERAVRPNHTEP